MKLRSIETVNPQKCADLYYLSGAFIVNIHKFVCYVSYTSNFVSGWSLMQIELPQ